MMIPKQGESFFCRIPLPTAIIMTLTIAALCFALIGQFHLVALRQSFAANMNFTTDTTVLPQLYKKAINSTVLISSSNTTAGTGAIGTGFIVDKVGHIVTNNHVVRPSNTGTVDVKFIDGDLYSAKIVGTDPYSDLAVIQLDPSALSKEKMSNPLPLGNSSALQIGQRIVVIGNPFGLAGSMSTGIVSAVRMMPESSGVSTFAFPDAIQTDAAVNHGNSGGPVLNLAGEVVGVATFHPLTPGPGGTIQGLLGSIGINFAIPSDTVRRVIPQLILNGVYHHPWVGIDGSDINSRVATALGLNEARGILVIGVTHGSPADLAGIAIAPPPHSPVVIGIDQKEVRTLSDILNYVDTKSVGDTVVLKVWKDGRIQMVNVKLAERPPTTHA